MVALLRVAILSDFTRIPYANGAAFQGTRSSCTKNCVRCGGHEVTGYWPSRPRLDVRMSYPDRNGRASVSIPLKTYPGLYLPLPSEAWVYDPNQWNFDIIF